MARVELRHLNLGQAGPCRGLVSRKARQVPRDLFSLHKVAYIR